MRRLAVIFAVTAAMLLTAATAFGREMDLVYGGETHRYSADDINILVDGRKIVTNKMPPIVLNEKTFVPVREFFEAVGCSVTGLSGADGFLISYGGRTLQLTADSRSIYVNGELDSLPADEPAPIVINGELMAPMRLIAEKLGFDVGWDGNSGAATLTSPFGGGYISKIVPATVDRADMVYLAYDSPAEPTVNRYGSPDRVVLDFPNTKLTEDYSEYSVNGANVISVRCANHENTARIVLDVRNQPNVLLSRTETGIVIAVSPADQGGAVTSTDDLRNGAYFDPTAFVDSIPQQTSVIVSAGGANAVTDAEYDYGSVVIDAGHGGYTGASSGGIMEDHITLAIALKVRDKLTAAGYNVVMTRTSDVKVSLQSRVDIASRPTNGNAIPVVFVSIHCNSFDDPSTNGTQVYYHTESHYGTILAQNIYDADVANTTLKGSRIRDGSDLYVVRKTVQPAALVETAFISNDSDRAYLTSEEGQEALANGITAGIIKTVQQMMQDRGLV